MFGPANMDPRFRGDDYGLDPRLRGDDSGLDPRLRGDDLLGVQFPLPASRQLQFPNPAPEP